MKTFCGNVRTFASKKAKRMKRTIQLLSLMLSAAVVLSSCLGKDEDEIITTYSDMMITSFTLGTLNRYQHTTSTKTGNDTIVKSTFTGSLYPMTIDHLGRTISNQDSLPLGTDVKHVICTVTAKNNGVVYRFDHMEGNDSIYIYHQSSDSVDLSKPLEFRVFAINGTGSRPYTVTLNVSQLTGTQFEWLQTGTTTAVDNFAALRLIGTADSVAWVIRDSIVAASTDELYAIGSDGRLKYSTDQGATWTEETTDEPDSLLPAPHTTAALCWPYTPADSTDYVLLIGAPRQDSINVMGTKVKADEMRVWHKIAAYGKRAHGGAWTYMPFDGGNPYRLPRQQYVSLARFDKTVLALGSDGKIYQSRDEGISWRESTALALPTALQQTPAAMANDEKGRLWIVTADGQVWQGYKR